MAGTQDLQAEVAIAGGGLSGLCLALHLHRAGKDFHLFEARPRFGGRVATFGEPGNRVDVGPSWFWPGQPLIARLIADLGLRVFLQHSAGDVCLEDQDGKVHRGAGFASMEGSFRVEGGMTALAEAMAARLPAERLHPDSHVWAVERDRGILLADGRRCLARHVVLAMPPRLVAGLDLTPTLPDDVLRRLRSVPTWMAGHAKCVAIYDRPFWREAGLSGDAMSRRGPLAEIHDASGADGAPAALFGFLGVPAAQRAGRTDQILDSARQQLARIFGPAAGSPRSMELRDWAFDPLTATTADQIPPQGHPAYGPIPALDRLWGGLLHLAATEIAPDMGGLMEGALASAGQVARRIIGAEP
ncbi:flavin monoamine oxidase family protein [Albidovulum sediminis]|uniref:FAD-dependent oxidoreductase n=1 Tax=Albidovulum sediminis TaxID=3066345 RepID=A0ABT2NP80_9RHOB|nr:FAD-dependent oxidoreductase [Defluviimonas sediminis]MCT8330737.1 FAD-dependent oxidoreductase [Defluviimonas sediminis]